MSENQKFSDVYRGYRNGTLGYNRLINKAYECHSRTLASHIFALCEHLFVFKLYPTFLLSHFYNQPFELNSKEKLRVLLMHLAAWRLTMGHGKS